jgi:glycerophosphoryl diester phosphodiesterase
VSGVRLIGHRGAAAVAAENTLGGVRRALADGADGVEIDVRILGDGTPALLHDETLDRTTDGSGALALQDVAGIAGLDAVSAQFPGQPPEPVPTLDALLDECFGRTLLALELKEPLPPAAYEALAARHRADREAELLVASFRAEILGEARDRLPAVPRVLVLRRDQPLPPDEVIGSLGLGGIFAVHGNVDERFVVDCRRHGLAAYAYTVNDAETAARLVAIGVAGILSDDPGSLRAVVPRLDENR